MNQGDLSQAHRTPDALRRDVHALLVRLGVPPPPLTDEAPLPPPDLVGRINAPDKRDPETFVRSGLADLAHLLAAAVAAGVPLARPAPAVLDLGCGAGRILRHIAPWASRVGAVDRHRDALNWIGTHLRGVETLLTSGEPPLDGWPDGNFDLVIANSVFTHIPLARQPAWLGEVARLLSPRQGVALITVLGEEHQHRLLDDQQRQLLARDGQLEVGAEVDAHTGQVAAFAAVFQTREASELAFGQALHLVGRHVAAGHQDVLVLTT